MLLEGNLSGSNGINLPFWWDKRRRHQQCHPVPPTGQQREGRRGLPGAASPDEPSTPAAAPPGPFYALLQRNLAGGQEGTNFKRRTRRETPAWPQHHQDEGCAGASQRPGRAALTHDGVLGLEERPPLAQPHGPAHLARVVLRHVYDLGRFGEGHSLPHAAPAKETRRRRRGEGACKGLRYRSLALEAMLTTEQDASQRSFCFLAVPVAQGDSWA